MRLSEDLQKWRAERPDEYTMDRFIKEATRLESVEAKFLQTNNSGSTKSCDYCADPSEAEHSICEPCLDRLIREGA